MQRAPVAAAAVGILIALSACSPPMPQAVKASASPSRPAVVHGSEPAIPSVSPAASPSPTPYPRLAIPAGTPRCRTSRLEVALVGAGAATGNVLNSFEMRNRSSAACWVFGYVGFQLLDGQGHPLPQTLRRSTESFFGRSDPPSRILLPPSTPPLNSRAAGHAFFDIATDDVLCNADYMNSIASLQIWPPDEYVALVIPARGGDWNGGFISCGRLSVNPLQIQPGLRTD